MKIPIFEWDEEKNKVNLAKHKVSFDDAARAYLDPNRMDFYRCYGWNCVICS